MLAYLLHSQSHRVFASNGGYVDDCCGVRSATGRIETIGTTDFELGESFTWGVGNPREISERQTGSWCFTILPFLDEAQVYQQVSFESILPIYLCPSRNRPRPGIPVPDVYGNYNSGGFAWSKTDFAANANVSVNLGEQLASPSSLIDGATYTIGIGEKAYDRRVHHAKTWYWDEPLFSGGSQGTARRGLKCIQDGFDIDFKGNWGASHFGLAHFAFMDGSTRSLSYSIHSDVFAALMTLNGNEKNTETIFE
jgi:hypothetical protein